MDINNDIKSHFARLPKYVYNNIVFYDKKDYDCYIQQNIKVYPQVHELIQSKK